MWQQPNQKSGSKKRVKPRMRLNVNRVDVVLKSMDPDPARQMKGRVLMLDLSNKGAGLFVAELLSAGQIIELEISSPKTLKLKGKVVWCQEHNLNSKVISETPFAFRAGIQFMFASAEEAAEAQKLCQELAAELSGQAKVQAA